MQQAYVELLTGKAKFEEHSSLKTFVISVIQNLAKGRYRRVASCMRIVQVVEQNTLKRSVLAPTTDENPELWDAVQKLPQRQRDIIEPVFCREMTIEDASRVMGVTTGMGRVHYDRAKKTLRAKLDDCRDLNHA